MIPAAFHGHTITGMRVPVLQNEDSSCSLRDCNTSNTASTPSISDVCTASAVNTACPRGSVPLLWAPALTKDPVKKVRYDLSEKNTPSRKLV